VSIDCTKMPDVNGQFTDTALLAEGIEAHDIAFEPDKTKWL